MVRMIGRLLCYVTSSHRLTRGTEYAHCSRCDRYAVALIPTGWAPPPETVDRHICLNERCQIR